MKPSKRFRFAGIRIGVECPDPAHLTWLVEFLAPAFAVDEDADADCAVILIIDDGQYGALAATRPAGTLSTALGCVLDQGTARLSWWSPSPGERVFADDDHEAMYIVSGERPGVRILSRPGNSSVRLVLMRTVRELAMTASWTPTSLVLHAAAVAAGDRGIIIAGPKHAGKTTLLLHCLRAPGVHFVSNDRLVMDCRTAPFIVNGMPTIVSIREGTLPFFPEFHARLFDGDFHYRLTIAEAQAGAPRPSGREQKRSGSLSPAQLCHLLAVPMIRQAAASVLLLPRVDAKTDGIVLRPLSAADVAARLGDVLFASTATERTSEVFRISSPPVNDEPATLQGLWRAAAQQLRAFECLMGPNAFQADAAGFLRRLSPP